MRPLTWLYHHSAKFRDMGLGQVTRKIDKFVGVHLQLNDIEKFKQDTQDLQKKSAKPKVTAMHGPRSMVSASCQLTPISWLEQNCLRQFVDRTKKYGFCVVKMKSQELDIGEVVDWLIPKQEPMSTMYGPTWEVKNEASDAINLAYTDEAIDFHTDLTYFSPPPTIQVLYCKQQAEVGGATHLKNAYAAAMAFKDSDPQDFELLSTYPTRFQKVHYQRDVPTHLIKDIPIMEHSHDGNHLVRVNWSPFVEGFTPVVENQWEEYYQAYWRWNDFIDNWDSVKIKLNPGELLAFHNHFMLHGRGEFEGNRLLAGFYLSYEQWLNLDAMS
jgi:alpha-ketoglutarate-dependent taurine dioxygenase